MSVIRRSIIDGPFTASALVLCVALAMCGFAAAMFERLARSPSDAADPGRLVIVVGESDGYRDTFTVDELDVVRQSIDVPLAAIGYDVMTVAAAGLTDRASIAFISDNYFRVIGRSVAGGRDFTPADFEADAAPVALVSHSYWKRDLRGAGLLGDAVFLNGTGVTVVGIAPEGVVSTRLDLGPIVFVPLSKAFQLTANRSMAPASEFTSPVAPLRWVTMVGRLDRLDSAASAQVRLRDRLAMLYGDGPFTNDSMGLVPLTSTMVPVTARVELFGIARTLVLVSVVFMVMATTVWVGVVMLRAESRRMRSAICLALGASRLRLFMPAASEVLLLMLLSTTLAVPLSAAVSTAMSETTLPGGISIRDLGLSVAGFPVLAVAIAGVVAASVALGAAWMGTGVGTMGVSSMAKASTGYPQVRLRRGVAVIMMANAVAILGISLLSTLAFSRLMSVDLGYDSDRVLNIGFDFRPYRYTPVQVEDFLERFSSSVQNTGLVESVGIRRAASGVARNGTLITSLGRTPVPQFVPFYAVDRDYFDAMGMSLKSGRVFDGGDVAGSPLVAVASESLASLLTSALEPVGQEVFVLSGYASIVGVVSNRMHNPRTRETMALYLPATQHQGAAREGLASLTRADVVLDTNDARAAKQLALVAAERIEPGIVPVSMSTAGEELRSLFALQHFTSRTMTLFAGVAILFMLLALYSLVKAMVRSKVNEVAIRSAMGASAERILLWFFADLGKISVVAMAIGASGVFLWHKTMTVAAGDVAGNDVFLALVVTALASFVSIAVAAAGPLRTIAKISPYEYLRSDGPKSV